ncbi:MAG: lipocalin family protein [Bacteroidales bacterium]|nr:lipocalin family protein [Bacteroidales bacterium]MDD3200627.1 lipocalin family protein [Bacteroidales bacterium]
MKKLTLFLSFLVALFTTSGCELWETLTSDKTLLYGQWNIEKIYYEDSESYYGTTTYTFVFDKDGSTKYQTWESTNSNLEDVIVASVLKGKYVYSENKHILQVDLQMKDAQDNTVVHTTLFQVKELTSQRLLIEVNSDESGIFSKGSTIDMEKM